MHHNITYVRSIRRYSIMKKEAFLWRSFKNFESQTLIHLCHCFMLTSCITNV